MLKVRKGMDFKEHTWSCPWDLSEKQVLSTSEGRRLGRFWVGRLAPGLRYGPTELMAFFAMSNMWGVEAWLMT